jgi:hypothetical protein
VHIHTGACHEAIDSHTSLVFKLVHLADCVCEQIGEWRGRRSLAGRRRHLSHGA